MTELEWIESWFKKRNWVPRDFQREAWDAYLRGENGLISVSTGFGKTYAGCLGAIAEMTLRGESAAGIQVLYISPLRALSSDIIKNLREPIEEMHLPFTIEGRSGDTTAIPVREHYVLFAGAWSPDGGRFALSTLDSTGWQIRVVRPNGNATVIVADTVPLKSPRWSSTGDALFAKSTIFQLRSGYWQPM